MNDKNIFIALSQSEARSLISCIDFLILRCTQEAEERDGFSQVFASAIDITAIELSELVRLRQLLTELADEQAELEASNEQPESSDESN